MGATVDMHQIYDAHIHQKDGAPVESIPFAAAQEWSAGLYWPGTLAISLCFMMVCRPALCPPCSLQRLPLSPTKGLERLLTVPYRALVRAQRGELMDPLPCNLAAMFLYRNPGHCFSGSAAKIAAD
jgi:hypothetical protein